MSAGCLSIMSPSNVDEGRLSFSFTDVEEEDVNVSDSVMDFEHSWHSTAHEEIDLICRSSRSLDFGLDNNGLIQTNSMGTNEDSPSSGSPSSNYVATKPSNKHEHTYSTNLLHLNQELGIQQLYCPRTECMVDSRAALHGKTILLYFSAAWCKPCKQFTPILKEWYRQTVVPQQNQLGSSNVEIVFVSLDHMKFNYDEYTNDMPWMCLTFMDSYHKRDELMSLYKVEGIPQVVIMSPDGEILNWDATPAIMEDPIGENFPWKRETLEDLLKNQKFTLPVPDISKLVQNSGFSNGATHPFCRNSYNDYEYYQLEKKYLILYFCASWCEACVDFTPLVCDTFKKMKTQRNDFEMIHISLDESEEGFNKFVSHLPCLSIPFRDAARRSKITSLYKISSIPTVLILGPVPSDGSERPIININARQVIASSYLNNAKKTQMDSKVDGEQLVLSNPCNVRHIENLLPPVVIKKPIGASFGCKQDENRQPYPM